MGAVHDAAQPAGVDEQHLAPPVPVFCPPAVLGQEPEVDGYLRRVGELTGPDHQVCLDEVLPDLALARLVRLH